MGSYQDIVFGKRSIQTFSESRTLNQTTTVNYYGGPDTFETPTSTW